MTLLAIQSVMDTLRLPVFVLSEDAVYMYQNPAAAEALGYRQYEIEGRHLTDLLDAEPQWVQGGFEKLKQTGHFSGPVLYRMKQGGLYRGDANVFMRSLQDGTMVAVSMVMPVSFGAGTSKVLQSADAYGLTFEDVRLLQLISVGLSDDQTAQVLNISRDELAEGVSTVFDKMAVSSKTAAVIKAIKSNLLL